MRIYKEIVQLRVELPLFVQERLGPHSGLVYDAGPLRVRLSWSRSLHASVSISGRLTEGPTLTARDVAEVREATTTEYEQPMLSGYEARPSKSAQDLVVKLTPRNQVGQ